MSHMSNLDIEMRCLQEDVKSLHARMLVERAVADYWYERAIKAEADMIRYAGLLGD